MTAVRAFCTIPSSYRATKGSGMKGTRLLAAAALTAGLMAVAPAASADENCVGAEGTLVVCVDPLGQTIYDTCVYTGGEECTPVSVPGPVITRCDGPPTGDPKAVVAHVIAAACDVIV